MKNKEYENREETQTEEKESEPSQPEEKEIEAPEPHEMELLKELENTKKQLEEEKEIEAPEPHEMELLKELENTKKQLEEEKDRFLRLNAEFDNFRKRTLKEREELIKYANEKLILELIDVYESLERGLESAKNTENKDKLIEGLTLIYIQFKNVLEKNGLVPIKAQDEKFDPYKHEAMMQTLTDEYDDGTILDEFARGYMLNSKVIRYSKVRVSKKKENKIEHEVN